MHNTKRNFIAAEIDKMSFQRKMELLEFLKKQISSGRVLFKNKEEPIVAELVRATLENIPRLVLVLAVCVESALKDKGEQAKYYVLDTKDNSVYGVVDSGERIKE